MPGPDDTPAPDMELPRPRLDISWKIKAAVLAVVIAALVALPRFWLTCFADCHTIQALGVSQANGNATGAFRIVTANLSGVATDRYAGACLVFRDPNGAGCVHGANQCQTATLASLQQSDPSAFAYCAPEKTCWYKISESHCRKSLYPGEGPYPVGTVKRTREALLSDVRKKLLPAGNAQSQIQARTIACLNGKFDIAAVRAGQAKPPCALAPATGDYVEKFGAPGLVTF